MKTLHLAAAVVLGLILLAAPAMADTGTTVAVPVGDWLGPIAGFIQPLLGIILTGALTWAATLLPPAIRGYINSQNIAAAEQLLEKAAIYGLNKVTAANAGKTLTIDTRNDALAQAVQYAIDHGPAQLIDWLGGEDAILQKIEARLGTYFFIPPTPVSGPAPAVAPAAT